MITINSSDIEIVIKDNIEVETIIKFCRENLNKSFIVFDTNECIIRGSFGFISPNLGNKSLPVDLLKNPNDINEFLTEIIKSMNVDSINGNLISFIHDYFDIVKECKTYEIFIHNFYNSYYQNNDKICKIVIE